MCILEEQETHLLRAFLIIRFPVVPCVKTAQLRDGPLEKLWGGEGNFRAAGIFRYQIPCMNFFRP